MELRIPAQIRDSLFWLMEPSYYDQKMLAPDIQGCAHAVDFYNHDPESCLRH